MDSVLYPARKSSARNHHPASALKKRPAVLNIRTAEYVEGYVLALRFNDGTKRLVDFAPFLNVSDNPLIRQYLETGKFKQFQLTNGNLEWNDYDLCFPIIDLYNNDLMHREKGKRKTTRRPQLPKNGSSKSKPSRKIIKRVLRKSSKA